MAIRNRPVGEVVAAGHVGSTELETLFIGLVRDYHRRVYNYVFRIVGDDESAEDLTQETFLRAYRALPKLPPGSNHRAWLFRIATNAAADELRRRKRRPSIPLPDGMALRAKVESEDHKLNRVVLDDALRELRFHHRVVLMLFEFAEFSAPEVGEVLGISPETARKRRQRARQALARVLDEGP
jgi:RNA polymerase sigma-70 factor (ECF subfamily)